MMTVSKPKNLIWTAYMAPKIKNSNFGLKDKLDQHPHILFDGEYDGDSPISNII